jgi:hypothetical protein
VAARAREARDEADAEALAADPFLAEALDLLDAARSILADIRWFTRGPALLAAAARALAREQASLDAALLELVEDVDGRDDVVPRAKPKTAGGTFLRTALGLDRHRAGREATTARLVTGERAELAAVGAAYAAGQISRGHLDVAAGVHRRLGKIREHPMPVADPDTGQVSQRRTIEVVDAVLAGYARAFSVPELARIGDHIIQTLNPPPPTAPTNAATCTCPSWPTDPCTASSSAAPPRPFDSAPSSPPSPPPDPAPASTPTAPPSTCPMNAAGRNDAWTPCSRPSTTTPAPTTSPRTGTPRTPRTPTTVRARTALTALTALTVAAVAASPAPREARLRPAVPV